MKRRLVDALEGAVLALLTAVLSAAIGGCAAHPPSPAPPVQVKVQVPATAAPRNVILLFADGTASTQWDFGRYSSHRLRKRPFHVTDVVFRQGALGLMSTCSATGMVTDSAAAASAMSTGEKTKNSMLSVAPDGTPRKTMMESAKAAGLRTGLVTTTAIYDASPAGFSVHANDRREFQSIVDQYRAFEPDVLIGEGADYFLPPPAGKRKDRDDVIAAFAAKGYRVVRRADDLRASDVGGVLETAHPMRLLGLFSDGDEPFANKPSLAERERAALRVLAQPDRGFILFVENEETDTAGHANDIASLMHALWDFDDAVGLALDFQKQNPDTLVIVTGDHETGGLSVTNPRKRDGSRSRTGPADAELHMIEHITLSLEAMAIKLAKLAEPPAPQVPHATAALEGALDRLLEEHFPGFALEADLRTELLAAGARASSPSSHGGDDVIDAIASVLARMVSRQTGFFWGTSGHTSEPVVVGAVGPGAEIFRGYQDNTEFARRLRGLITSRSPK